MSYRSRTLFTGILVATLGLAACDSNDDVPGNQRDITPPPAERGIDTMQERNERLREGASETYDDLRDNTAEAWENTRESASDAADRIESRSEELYDDARDNMRTE